MVAAISIIPAIVWWFFGYSVALKTIPIVGFYVIVYLVSESFKKGGPDE